MHPFLAVTLVSIQKAPGTVSRYIAVSCNVGAAIAYGEGFRGYVFEFSDTSTWSLYILWFTWPHTWLAGRVTFGIIHPGVRHHSSYCLVSDRG